MFSKEELNTFYRYCISLTADENSAGDLLQCCLEKYVRRNTSGVEDVKAYFRRMIRNQFIDDQRKEGNKQLDELDEENTVIPLDTRSLDDIIVAREMVEIILSSLTPHEREILFLWAVEGFTIQDISNDLGIPKGTLLSRLHRLKIKVKNKFGARKIMGGGNMTQKLKESIKEYYEKHNLPTIQLLQMQNIQKKQYSQFNRRRRLHSHWAIAAGAVVILLGAFIFFNITGHRTYIAELISEIAYNHNRNLEMEIKSNSLKEIATYLSRLEFPLIHPGRLPPDNWEMIGGRYCSLKGQFAAQLKLRNKVDQKIYTLYQIEKPHGINNIADFSEHFAKGVKVNLWIERGLILALAGKN